LYFERAQYEITLLPSKKAHSPQIISILIYKMPTPKLIVTLACALLCVACEKENEPQKETFTDPRDKKTYKTTKIGEQVWMAENLNYKAENSLCYGEDGNVDRLIFIGTARLSDKEIQANCDKYGRLYNWEAAMKACPNGWHLPSDEEWVKLYRYVGGSEIAGKYLKSKSGWTNEFILYFFKTMLQLMLLIILTLSGDSDECSDCNLSNFCKNLKVIFGDFLKSSNGEDTFGFTALPGGYSYDKSFGHYDFHGACWSAHWWSSTSMVSEFSLNANDAYKHDMYSNGYESKRSNNSKSYFYYVRCLQDNGENAK